MTLTTEGKNYIAQKFGINNCFVASGLSWSVLTTMNETVNETGGTAQIVNRLISGIVSSVNIGGVQYTYSSVKVQNGNTDFGAADVTWIISQDGSQGPVYCAQTSTVTPTPAPTQIPNPTQVPGSPQTFEFQTAPSGTPSISLDLTTLDMQQNSSDMHFEMNQVKITNTSQWRVYIAAEVRMFQGSLTYCPSSGAVFIGMNRTESLTRALRIASIDPGVTATLNLDFFQPSSLVGIYTICLYIHGTFIRADLENEVSMITG